MRLSIPATLRWAMVAAFAGGLLLFGHAPTPSRAQQAINVVSNVPRNEFPTGVTFTLSFTSPAPTGEVRLQYRVAPDGTGATGVADCNTATTTNCSFTLQSGRGIFVIPGAEITYHWVIEDQSGDRTETPDQVYVHQDTRFDFRTLNGGNVTVYYHSGTETEADDVLAAARETLDRVGALEGAQVTFPVKVFLYATAQEMQPAIAPGGGRGVQILGEVVYSDTAMVSADVDTLDIARHEVAHIVTREATKGPFGVPGWFNEGISVFSQRQPLSGHAAALESAIRNDRVLTMAELNSSATGSVAGTVGLYYGQAGSMVAYLVNTYGDAKFAQLMKVFKDGATLDDAFNEVYGFDALGYENEWRKSVGLQPREAAPTPTPQPTEQARAQPTAASAGDSSANANKDGDGGLPVVTLLIAGMLVLAIVGAGALTLSVVRSRL